MVICLHEQRHQLFGQRHLVYHLVKKQRAVQCSYTSCLCVVCIHVDFQFRNNVDSRTLHYLYFRCLLLTQVKCCQPKTMYNTTHYHTDEFISPKGEGFLPEFIELSLNIESKRRLFRKIDRTSIFSSQLFFFFNHTNKLLSPKCQGFYQNSC